MHIYRINNNNNNNNFYLLSLPQMKKKEINYYLIKREGVDQTSDKLLTGNETVAVGVNQQ